ncbi:MAG: excinuclease ABC subunit UvrA [Candidatus Hydrothermarchaeales archaeon]
MGLDSIVIKGASEHNLKNIDLEIPREKFVVITGISGSGKSSLAFDTIYSEGQRRYVESLSAYARQFLGLMKKPNVELIEGLSPAISIDQKTRSKNPRSTVGTVTEIYDYLRLLYARIGVPHCPNCGKRIEKQTVQQIVDQVMQFKKGTKIQVLSPVVWDRKGEYQALFEEMKKDGYVRAVVDGEVRDLDEDLVLERYVKHTIEVVVDRLKIKPDVKERLADSIETAINLAEGIVVIDAEGQKKTYSEQFACTDCGISLGELVPRMFSFNSPHGACPDCQGLGTRMEFDPDLVIPDKRKSIMEGAIAPWSTQIWGYRGQALRSLGEHFGFNMYTPIKDLNPEHLGAILYGTNDTIDFHYKSKDATSHYSYQGTFEGVIPNMDRLYKQTESQYRREEMERFMAIIPCPSCHGARLKPISLSVSVTDKSISQITKMSVAKVLKFFEEIKLKGNEALIASGILKEIKERLGFMVNVGLDYLTLDRASRTLSGGESQRIRLATQVGSGLVGVLYILDEPSIGLHQRDNKKLISTLIRLRDLGNTILVVEHDETTIKSADYVIDMGPGAGEHGGRIVAMGTPEDIMAEEKSLTGLYLSHKMEIPIPNKRRKQNGTYLTIKGAGQNNLKGIDVKIPLKVFTCITGVSGSGKSSLVTDTLYPALCKKFYRSKVKPGIHDDLEGVEYIDKVIEIDQSPIGRTPRSNPATYTGVFTPIRELFAKTPESRKRGYKPGRFSFNVKGGRCEACNGDGIIKIEMHFLPDVYVPCEVCKSKRYGRETLQVKYKGKNISDVLEMTVEEALEFFKDIPTIKNRLQTLSDVGLGYIKLGQPATTLSGGEAQRVKLSTELSKRSTGKTLYILDEPTTGLHFADIQKLLDVLSRLTDAGNTVVVVEHNLDVIKTADHIIDLGPEGGEMGGTIVAEGTPEEISKMSHSYTGMSLKKAIGG